MLALLRDAHQLAHLTALERRASQHYPLRRISGVRYGRKSSFRYMVVKVRAVQNSLWSPPALHRGGASRGYLLPLTVTGEQGSAYHGNRPPSRKANESERRLAGVRRKAMEAVEDSGIEPLTYGMQIRRSPS